MHLVTSNDPLSAYLECADFVVREGQRKSDMAEVQDLVLKIELERESLKRFNSFVERIRSDPLVKHGAEKADRAYRRRTGNITKPSYISRIREFPFVKIGTNFLEPIDQLQVVVDKFAEAPQSSNLAISVFHPSDLRDAFRPGYVPCLSFIDVKFRSGGLFTKYYFRSCDFAEVAVFDIYHCINLHTELKNRFLKVRPDVDIRYEALTFFFSRAFTYNRKREPISFIRAAATAAI